MILKGLVSKTLGESVAVTRDGAYDIPADFYLISSTKYMTNRKGKIFGVTGATIVFTTEDYTREVTWKYMDSFADYSDKLYFYCHICDNYKIVLICKDINDNGFVTGFTEDEVMELVGESKEQTASQSLMPTLSALTSSNTPIECSIEIPNYINDYCKAGIELLVDKLNGVNVKGKDNGLNHVIYDLEVDKDALQILKTLAVYDCFNLVEH